MQTNAYQARRTGDLRGTASPVFMGIGQSTVLNVVSTSPDYGNCVNIRMQQTSTSYQARHTDDLRGMGIGQSTVLNVVSTSPESVTDQEPSVEESMYSDMLVGLCNAVLGPEPKSPNATNSNNNKAGNSTNASRKVGEVLDGRLWPSLTKKKSVWIKPIC